jgi:GH25 family lysozyme M1 (1,4-beta-N-acetylmuramidase)
MNEHEQPRSLDLPHPAFASRARPVAVPPTSRVAAMGGTAVPTTSATRAGHRQRGRRGRRSVAVVLVLVASVVVTAFAPQTGSASEPGASPVRPERAGTAAAGTVVTGAITPGTTTRCAGPSTIEGIDVSQFQGASIGWSAVKTSGRQFAYARALDGIGTHDTRFVENYQGIKAAGMKAGAYHFFRGWADPVTQARVFIDKLQAAGYAPGDLLPVIDAEADPDPTQAVSPATYIANLRTMEAIIEDAIGTPPMIYTGPYFWAVTLGNPGGFSNNPLWIANYGNACPEVPNSWPNWTMWQYSQTGSVSGVGTAVDLDRFNGAVLPSAPSAAPHFFESSPPTPASVGTPYTYRFRASGVPTPTYAVAGGALPPGVTLNPTTGALTGEPTNPGSYNFSVRASNGVGPDELSSVVPLTIIVAPPAAGFHSMVPFRVLDSRVANGWSGKVSAGADRDLVVTGASGVPATASAVVMNVTVVESTNESFLTVYPGGTTRPNASNLNFGAGQIIPNLTTVRVGTGGVVRFANAVGATHVVADIVGYYDDGAPGGELFNGLDEPQRILDSRFGNQWSSALGPGVTRDLQVTGHGTVPAGATSVVMNVTAIGGNDLTFLQVWPAGSSQPNSSNLNVSPGQIIPNLVTVKLGPSGAVSIYNEAGSTQVIADVVGYFGASGSHFFSLPAPRRIIDTRYAVGYAGRIGDTPRAVTVTGRDGIPVGATGLVANVTVAAGSEAGFLTVFPGDKGTPPTASNLNFGRNQVIPNLVSVRLPTADPGAGQLKLYNSDGLVYVIADAVGYYAP